VDVSTISSMILPVAVIGLFIYVVPLVLTIAVEVPVAGAFGLGRRGMAAAVLINVVTNPALNFIVLVLFGLGFGFTPGTGATFSLSSWFSVAGYAYVLLSALEVAVVLIEWRMLVWALSGTKHSPRRLLAASVTMNVASFLAGVLVTHLVLR
jgi:hypothetical protein